MTIEEIAEKALALAEAATPGEWRSDDMPVDTGAYWTQVDVDRPDQPALEVLCRTSEGACADAALIAFSRSALPELARAVLALRTELDTVRRVDMETMRYQRDRIEALRKVEQAARSMRVRFPVDREWWADERALAEALAALDSADREREAGR